MNQTQDGDIFLEIPFHLLRFKYLSPEGEPLDAADVQKGLCDDKLKGINWIVEGPGIDPPHRVKRVILPHLEYNDIRMPTAIVVLWSDKAWNATANTTGTTEKLPENATFNEEQP